MTVNDKILAKARDSAVNLTFDELCHLAELNGFIFRRQTGSHKIYRHSKYKVMMNFQPMRNGMAKMYQVKQLLNFIDEYLLGGNDV